MSDHISRDAAIELLSQPITMSMCLSVEECHHKIAQQRIDRYLIENIPAADVRPMVLCKDCKYSYDSVSGWCCSHGICVDCIVREDFFCADGKKREES